MQQPRGSRASSSSPRSCAAMYALVIKSPCWGSIPEPARISLMVCLFYATASVSLSMLNKALLSSYEFKGYFALLFCQLTLSYLFCWISRDYYGNPFGIPVYQWAQAKGALAMGVTYVVNVGVGLLGLRLVNVPMFFALRRLVAPMVLIYEFFAMGKVADIGVQGSVAIIVLGTIVAGWDSFGSDFMGYAITMLNNLLTAASSVMQKQFSDSTKLTTFSIVYYNSCVAAPLALVLMIITGEVEMLVSFPHLMNGHFWAGYIVASLMGLVLTYSSLLSTTYNSPLATSITGNAKDILTTLIGWLAFSGFVATFKSVGGIVLSFIGAFLYSYVNLMKQMKKPVVVPAPAATVAAVAAKDVEGLNTETDIEAREEMSQLIDSAGSRETAVHRVVPAVSRSV